MKSHVLFLLAVITIIQVDAEVRGARAPDDYLLDHRVLLVAAAPTVYSTSYQPTTTPTSRPELITCMEMIADKKPTYIFTSITGGPKTGGYSVTITDGPFKFISYIYGKPPIVTEAMGSLSRNDKLLHIETITKSALPDKIIIVNLKYPKLANGAETLNWISVLDKRHNDTASIRVVQGGAGYKAVHLQLISRVGEGINFKVQIYGKNMTTNNWPWYFSFNAGTEALLFDPYWVYDPLYVPAVKKNCGCRTGRSIVASP